MRVFVILFLIFLSSEAFGGNYSIQLGTFYTYNEGKRFLEKLPDPIKREAFLYKTDKGYWTVRYLVLPKVSLLRKKTSFLRALGIKNFSFVPTDPKKLRKVETVTPKRKKAYFGILDLLYSVYLGNGKVDKAFEVAKRGVEKYPDSPLWWERLRTVSLWSNHPKEALKAEEVLVFKFHKEEYLKDLYSLSLSLGKPKLALKVLTLLKKKGEPVGYEKFLQVYHLLGEPEKAADYIVREFKNNSEALRVAVDIYRYKGLLDKALRTLKLLEKTGKISPKDKLVMAQIYFAKGKFLKSLNSLKKNWNQVKELSYLKTLSDLSWTLGDFKTSVEVSKKLVALDKGRREDYDRLVFFYYFRSPKEALRYALEGYKKTGSVTFFNSSVFLLSSLNRWEEVVELIDSLPKKVKEKVLSDRGVLSTYIYALSFVGRTKDAKKFIYAILQQNPDSEVVSQLIYLLIKTKKVKELKKTLEKYKVFEPEIPRDFLAAYLFLQKGKEALKVLDLIKDTSPSFLLTKADVLELCGRENWANKLRFLAFKKLKKEVSSGNLSKETVEPFLRSAIYFERPDSFEKLFVKLKGYLPKKTAENIYLSYLLYRGREEKVQFLYRRKKTNLEPWMKLTLALYYNDKFFMKRLLDKFLSVLPIRDRVTALENIEEFGKAFTVAYKGLEDNGNDNRLYRQFRDLTVNYLSHFSLNLSFFKSGKLRFANPSFSFRNHVEDDLYLEIEGFGLSSFNGGNLFNSSKSFEFLSVGFKKYLPLSKFSFGLSLSKSGTYSRIGGYLKFQKKLFRGSSLLATFYGRKPADASEVAAFSTLKSGLRVDFSFPLTNKEGITLSFERNNYNALDGTFIGRGTQVYSEVTYKARTGYPDYLFRVFILNNRYSESAHAHSYADRISSYPPADVLPKGFYQFGVGFNFGFENRNSFVRVWRPYLDASVSYNNKYKMNASFLLGIGGKLFGDDNIHFEVGAFNGFKGVNSSGWSVSSGYNLWF